MFGATNEGDGAGTSDAVPTGPLSASRSFCEGDCGRAGAAVIRAIGFSSQLTGRGASTGIDCWSCEDSTMC
jgi:hypothetical protein